MNYPMVLLPIRGSGDWSEGEPVSEKKTIDIAGRLIGEEQPCFIIAEAGVNHNGDISLARRLIDAASDAKADAVKFQTFSAEKLVTNGAEKARYQKETTGDGESQYEMLKKLELTGEDFRHLFSYCSEKGILFLSSPFDKESADFLDDLGVSAFKIPSGEITNIPLLRYIARKKKPVILSTGMATLGEIEEAVNIFLEQGSGEIILLHCVSSYPAKVEDINLNVITTLERTFGLPVGLSDHTTGITVPIAASALGACVIEKHFTLDRKLPGPDHRASLEPEELINMIEAVRDVEKALGDGIKTLTAEEEENKKLVRRSIVAKVDIAESEIIAEEMLETKRPAGGIEPKYLDKVIGKKATRPIKSGEKVTFNKIG